MFSGVLLLIIFFVVKVNFGDKLRFIYKQFFFRQFNEDGFITKSHAVDVYL